MYRESYSHCLQLELFSSLPPSLSLQLHLPRLLRSRYYYLSSFRFIFDHFSLIARNYCDISNYYDTVSSMLFYFWIMLKDSYTIIKAIRKAVIKKFLFYPAIPVPFLFPPPPATFSLECASRRSQHISDRRIIRNRSSRLEFRAAC